MNGQPIASVTGWFRERAGATGTREHADTARQTKRARNWTAHIESSPGAEGLLRRRWSTAPRCHRRSLNHTPGLRRAFRPQGAERLATYFFATGSSESTIHGQKFDGFAVSLPDLMTLIFAMNVTPKKRWPRHAPARSVPIRRPACDMSADSCLQARCARRSSTRPRKPE